MLKDVFAEAENVAHKVDHIKHRPKTQTMVLTKDLKKKKKDIKVPEHLSHTVGLRLASSQHKNKVCQQVSFCMEFARLLYMCRFLCQCGCEWLPVCVSHRLATYRGCAPPLAPRPLERVQPLCNPKFI